MSSTVDALDTQQHGEGKRKETVETVVVRFCGDSGDGMQLVGTQMTNVSAIYGNDVSTLPDFPAEIRAPAGTLAGVSGYQLCFSNRDIFTPGDAVDTLVSMNPAALKTNVADLKRGGTLIVNEDAFDKSNVAKATYESNPLEDEDLLQPYRVHKEPMTRLTRDAVEGLGLTVREADRCKNFFALGLIYWLYERDATPTENWVKAKFASKPEIQEANLRALRAGYNFGFSTESFTVHYHVEPAQLPPGRYRKLTGNEATALGLVTAAKLAGQRLFYAGYPITPASDILHELAAYKNFGVRTFQAEDEIASMCAAVGAAFAGQLSVTASSGPGICLKGEAMAATEQANFAAKEEMLAALKAAYEDACGKPPRGTKSNDPDWLAEETRAALAAKSAEEASAKSAEEAAAKAAEAVKSAEEKRAKKVPSAEVAEEQDEQAEQAEAASPRVAGKGRPRGADTKSPRSDLLCETCHMVTRRWPYCYLVLPLSAPIAILHANGNGVSKHDSAPPSRR